MVRGPQPIDFRTADEAECYVEFDMIMAEPDGPERDANLLSWAKYWAPALLNRIRPIRAPIG
jgi:hypothetical protein